MKTEYNILEKSTAESTSTQNAAHECPTSLVDGNVCRPLINKVCKNCKIEKGTSQFYFNSTKVTYFSECKQCNKARSTKWNKNNKDKYTKNCKKHKDDNPDLYKEYKSREYEKHKTRYAESSKRYRNSKHGKGVRQALGRERELKKSHATPTWLTQEQREQMKQFYINRPEGYHVDHIVPLNGKNFSGLHVPWNLQYLPANENIRKRNNLK